MIPDDMGKPRADISVDLAVYDGYGSDRKHAVSVNLRKANPGEFTDTTVIRMFVNGAKNIRNIKIGIIDSDKVSVSSSGTANPDGTMSIGNAGISHGATSSVVVSSYFKGMNQSGKSDDANNVPIANGSPNSSEYIALNVQTPSEIGEGYLAYRWFFDFVE
jgi:hypothetical protein